MSKLDKNEIGKLAGAAAIGATIGALAATLLTPKSGRQLRNELKSKATNTHGKMKDRMSKG